MLLLRALAGIHRQQPLQALLMLGGLALSIAVVVAIDISIGSAREAFSEARRSLSGDVSHRVVAVSGRLDQRLYAELRLDGLRAAPVLEGRVRTAAGPLAVLGIDPLAEWQLRPDLLRQQGSSDAPNLLAPRGIALSLPLARRLGLDAGQSLDLPATQPPLEVVAVLGDAGSPETALADIGLAQTLLDAEGLLSRIDLRLDPEQVDPLITRLPPGTALVASAEADGKVLGMSRAFEINLQALSLLALLVGVFLVFQSLGFLGLRRRPLIARLRALGVARPALARWLLVEAALIGLAAALIGLLLGMLLALPLQQGIARSYDALFFDVGSVAARLDALTAGKALLLGLGGALAAAWRPLREALSVEPLEGMRDATLEARAADTQRARRWPALVLAAGSLALLALGPEHLLVAFAALFGLLIALLGLLPPLAAALVAALRRLLGQHAPVRVELLLASVQGGLSRTGTALAALTLAMATLVGMSAMIDSFRGSVMRWIDHSLTADVYLSPAEGERLPQGLPERLARVDGVAAVATTLRRQLTLDSGPVWLVAYDLPPRGFAGFEFLAGDSDDLYPRFQRGEALISEPLARRLDLAPGDVLRLPTGNGPHDLPVAAVYRDYASPQGTLAIHRTHYAALFDDPSISGAALFAEPEALPALDAALPGLLARTPGVRASRASEIRERSLEVFARTFAVTDVLRALAGLIAAVAVFGALSALQLERQRELALLRCLGYPPSALTRLQLGQGLLLGLLAALFALPLGALLAALLTEVIQQRAFGWSMRLRIGPGPLLGTAALAAACALLAAWWPARRIARVPLPNLLRGPG
ncbi:FtsX-like permease family protein [Pseudomarimonas salicorniae]|uniref:FtsX-like permease family protein n=1 Tax=Pseudomarimonas salicorniae TaxID=2933270 RepID=A0ABT0GHT6_9GAMM|nr:FtsX-like permease family protein [Lysobacter sp. CAU 1642]MCK7593729.1 FtsX-like permease family protein [Lysobacter sp. CAU 1642]